MNLPQVSLRRPYSVVVVVVALCLLAFAALNRMTRDVFPPLGVPSIYVAQPYGGMSPEQMEGFLTYYYEYHFLYITGIEHVESKSIQGASIMKLQFHPGTDMSQALSETIAYVNRARAFMPPGTPGPFVTRFDAGSVPVGQLVFSTDNPTRTVGQMQDAALNLVRPLFATLPGVSAPPPFGGSARTILINVQPDRLRAYNLTPDEVVTALTQANTLSPAGSINLGGQSPIVPVNAVVKNIQDLAAVPLRTGTSGPVFVRDVATVDDGSDLVTSYALVNGRRTVYMPVTKRSDASTLSVVELVRQNLPKFQAAVPDDIKVSYEFDQSPVVLRAIGDLVKEGLLGAVLTGVMVMLFLRDWRTAFVVIVNIPVALLGAAVALWLCGQNINLMTLGGLALAVGILVDEATVSVENIHRHRAAGRPLASAVLEASLETAGPRLLAMLCILAVFVPALFMTGAAKSLFLPLALAVGFSMVASYLLSSTLVPVLCVWLLPSHYASAAASAASGGRYAALVTRLVQARLIVVGAYLATCVGIVWLLGARLGTEIFPSVDSGQLAIRFRTPSGTQLERTEAAAQQLLALVKRETGGEGVQLSLGLVGVHAPNYPVNLIHLWNGGPEEGYLQFQLRPGIAADAALRERLRASLAREMPDLRVSFEPSDIISRVMSFGANTPIEVAVSGPSLPASKAFAEKLLERLRSVPALRDVHLAQNLDAPTVDVNVDRERAGLAGVKMTDVTRSLVAATASSRFTVPNYWADPNSGVAFSVQVQIPTAKTTSLDDLGNIPVGGRDGRPLLLRNVAAITPGTTVGQYERYNMARVVTVTANLEGSDLGKVAREVEAAVRSVGSPPARTSVAIRGQIVPLTEMQDGLRQGLLVAVVVVFLLLAANFQSLRLPLVAVATLPATLAGVVGALAVTGTTLNLQSLTGAIMAIGVSMANAILLVTFAERARTTGCTGPQAAIAGATSRLRPILMTVCAMVAGMLPMALGLGEGGAQTAPLGRAVIGGLIAATLATLLVLPAAYALATGERAARSPSLDPQDPASPHFTPPTSA
jgi:multidrug efflux pump subunit AcrB